MLWVNVEILINSNNKECTTVNLFLSVLQPDTADAVSAAFHDAADSFSFITTSVDLKPMAYKKKSGNV